MRASLARLAVWGRLLCALAMLVVAPAMPAAGMVQDIAAEHAPAPPRRPPRPPFAVDQPARAAAPAPAVPRAPTGRVRHAGRTPARARPPGQPAAVPARLYVAHRALLL